MLGKPVPVCKHTNGSQAWRSGGDCFNFISEMAARGQGDKTRKRVILDPVKVRSNLLQIMLPHLHYRFG